MQPNNANSFSFVAPFVPAEVSDADVSAKLESLLSSCVHGGAALKQEAHSYLVDWVEGCLPEELGAILDGLLSHAERPSSLQIAAGTAPLLIVREFPSRHDQMVNRLLSRLAWNNNAVRNQIIDLLAEAVRLCPNSGTKIIRELLWASARFGTLETALVRLFKMANDETAQEAIDVISCQCIDSRLEVRTSAARHLVLFTKALPERRESVMLALFRSCNDVSATVRIAAIESLDSIFEVIQDKASEIVQKLLDMYDDREASVRSSVIRLLHKHVNHCPEKAEEIYIIAFALSSDEDPLISNKARDLLVKLVDFCPEKVDEAASVLLASYRVEPIGRKAEVIRLIGELMGRCSRHLCEEIADLLIQCCRIDHQHPEREALRQMGKAVRSCPSRAEEIAEIVLHWSKRPHRKSWFQDWHHFLQVSVPKITDGLQDTKTLDITFPSARAIAINQLGHVAGACPRRTEEILSLVLQTCEDRDEQMQLASVSQLGPMVEACPDKSELIAAIVLRFCSNDVWLTRAMAVIQLSKLAAVHTGNRGPIVEALLQACKGRLLNVRIVAIAQLPGAMQMCPEMARRIFALLLAKCASENSSEVAAAKAQLVPALLKCPDIAIVALERLMAYRPTKVQRLT